MKLDMIGLVVSDIDQSIRFYRQLGVEIPDRVDDSPYHETTLPNGLRLSFNAESMVIGIDPEWKKPVGQGIGLAFLCDSVEDVNQTHAKLVAAGYKSYKDPWDAFWGHRYALITDPDGYVVDLFAPLSVPVAT